MMGADVDPSNGLGERRGVSPPVLHPPASPTKFEVPTGGLTPNAPQLRKSWEAGPLFWGLCTLVLAGLYTTNRP